MNREVEKIFQLAERLFHFLLRTVETVLLRLRSAQESVTDTVRSTLPEPARVKFAVMQRAMAKGIDLAVVVLLGVLIWGPIGPFVGFFYSLVADGIDRWGFSGQSVGKRIIGLRVVRVSDGRPARWRDSVLRNLPVGVATFFAIIPFWGWILFVLVGGALAAVEVLLMFRLQGETRLGDVMADTRVVEVPRGVRR